MATFTVSDYLLTRLKSLNVDHVFGIPGDFILPFFDRIVESDVEHVAACNELNAGYAADGYARLKGLGAVVSTYGPGAFSYVNAVAGAYAESVPLVVISGGPDTSAYQASPQPLLHHTLPNHYDASIKIFEQITAYSKVLVNAETAAADIDEALRVCLTEKKPVYLEIPTNVQLYPCDKPQSMQFDMGRTKNTEALENVLQAISVRIQQDSRTVILPGHEIHRHNLQEKLVALIEKTGLPVGTLFIGKAEYLEQLPQCIGAYQGAGSLAHVREFVEEADNVIYLGAVESDFNLGGFTANLTAEQKISVFGNSVTIEGETYQDVPIVDLVEGLLEALPAEISTGEGAPVHGFSHTIEAPYDAESDQPMTNKRFYDRMARFFQAGDIVMTDAGCAINATHLQLPAGTDYVSSCFWASIGMGFGATLGACFAAEPGQRIIALEGDGSFQMTAQELSTMTRYGKSPIVFIVNNQGYTAERLIHDGPFNDIADWKYHKLPAAFGGVGLDVHTEGDFEEALAVAADYHGAGPLVIEVHIDPWDASEAFKLMSEMLRH